MPEDGQLEQRRRLAAATRLVIDRLVGTTAPAELVATAADRMEGFADTLASYPHGRTYEGYAEPANAPGPSEFFDHSPMSGTANPVAPPAELWVEDGTVHGRVTFSGA